jgi:hypothetical protein
MSPRKARRPASGEENEMTELERHDPPTAARGHEPHAEHPAAAISGAVAGIDDVRAPLVGEGRGPLQIRRRDLLAWGGAAALYPALSTAARAQSIDEAAVSQAPQPMSVGYVEGSDGWRRFRSVTSGTLSRGVRAAAGSQPEAASVVPATSLIAGDQQLANQVVMVRVHGLYPVPNPLTVKSAYLTVYYPSDNPGRHPSPLPFIAWGYKSRPAPDVPAPIQFRAPLGPTGELELRLDVSPGRRSPRGILDGSAQPGGVFTTNFTVDWFEGRPRLQRGVYLLGFAPGMWETQRALPRAAAGRSRPLELLSLMVSFDPIAG